MIDINSCSYAEDVTSVTSGASQGPHSFNLMFICLFAPSACLALSRSCPVPVPYHTIKDSIGMPGAISYLSRTVPSKTAGHNILFSGKNRKSAKKVGLVPLTCRNNKKCSAKCAPNNKLSLFKEDHSFIGA